MADDEDEDDDGEEDIDAVLRKIAELKEGGLFDELGIQDGEIITEVNGIQIDSTQQSAQLMSELASAQQLNVTVDGPGGTRRLKIDVPEE